MRVAYVCPTQELYGDNIAILKIMPLLIESGVEPLFVLPYKGESAMTAKLNEMGIPFVQDFVFHGNTWSRNLLAFLRALRSHVRKHRAGYRSLLEKVKAFSPDLVHTNNSFTLLGYMLSRDLNVPNVQHVREYGIPDANKHYFPCKFAEKRILTAPNQHPVFITEDIQRYFKINKTDSDVVLDGVFDSATYTDVRNAIADENYFLFVGRITKVKGIFDIVECFLRFCYDDNSGITLKIAGSGSEDDMARLRNIVTSHPNGHRIEILGYRTDVYELMSKARALIVASKFEAFGFISVEAMLNGCPVIGHNVAGTKMQFDLLEKYAGKDLAFRFNNKAQLIDQMHKLSQINKKDFQDEIEKARCYASQNYSAQKSAGEIKKVYDKILSRN